MSQKDSASSKGFKKIKPKRKKLHLSTWFILLFIALMLISLLFWQQSPLLILFYFFLSVLTFTVYWRDKTKAQSGSRRTPERVLHLLSLFGGWPGAILAQSILRHKSSKVSFRRVFWLTCMLNCLVLVWYLVANSEQPLTMIQF